MCSDHHYNEYQFGFIPGRSTAVAKSLVHDISEYCKSMGSTVFMCSLDAEAAYDAIPHSILFDCTSKVLNPCIKVSKGLRQGGLTSLTMFNLFYRPLIDSLASSESGIIINNRKHNVFCYADVLLLTNTTVTGLQSLIDQAVSYVSDRGLNFNPAKTICMTYGKNPFRCEPEWNISGI